MFLSIDQDRHSINRYFAYVLSREWRTLRLQAASQILSAQNVSPPAGRVTDGALTLTAALVWFINGLHARPSDDRFSRDLMRASLTTTENTAGKVLIYPEELTPPEREDDAGTPYIPSGAIFLRDIVVLPKTSTPRFRFYQDDRRINDESFAQIFQDTPEKLRSSIYNPGIETQDHVHKMRYPVVKTRTRARQGPLPHPEAMRTIPDAVLQQLVIHYDEGDDIPIEEHRRVPGNMADLLNKLWNDFLSDVLQVCGSPRDRGRPSYLILTSHQRRSATEAVYRETNLAKVFTAVQWRKSSEEQWRASFDLLFPDRTHMVSAKAQNYRSCGYWLKWMEMITGFTQDQANEIRSAAFEQFNTLYWVPLCRNDRIWDTRRDQHEFHIFPANETRTAVKINIHPDGLDPSYDIDGLNQ